MRTTKRAMWGIAAALLVCAAVVLGVLRGRVVPPPPGGEIQKSRPDVQEPHGAKIEAARRPDVELPRAQSPVIPPRDREIDRVHAEIARSGVHDRSVTFSGAETNRDPRTGVSSGQVEEVTEAVQEEEAEATTDFGDGDRSGLAPGQVVEAEQQPEDMARTGTVR
jgi:hypothetical protein